MRNNRKTILLIVPSILLARGLESVFGDLGEFDIAGILPDLSRSSEARLRNMDADIIIVDPVVFDYSSRCNARTAFSCLPSVPVVALVSSPQDEDSLKQYDEVICLYDEPTTIIKKLRNAIDARQDTPKNEGEELSAREKEILVCVARGMLNKEIADQYNISIYTVITHRKNITRKTGIKTVAGLTVYALLNNLIEVGDFE